MQRPVTSYRNWLRFHNRPSAVIGLIPPIDHQYNDYRIVHWESEVFDKFDRITLII